MVVCSSGTRVEYSFASSLFQDSQSTKIIDIERLAELSSVYLDDDGGLRFSETNWSGDGSVIIFETVGQDNVNHLWKLTLNGNSSQIEELAFPYDKFSELYGLKASFDDLLFAGVPEFNGSDVQPGTFNLYKFNLAENNITKLTDFSDASTSTIANFDWMPEDNIVYETVTPIYPDDPNEPIGAIKTLWLLNTSQNTGGQNPSILWNGSESIASRSMDASPDGKHLAFGGDTRLRVFDVNDKNFTDIVSKEQWSAKGIYPASPKWSSNSEFIVYWQTEYHELPSSTLFPKDNITTWLRIASSDGSINEAVFRNPGPVLSSELPAPAISPDGRFVAIAIPYVPYNYENDNAENGGIYLIELGSHVVPEFPLTVFVVSGALALITMIVFRYRAQISSVL